LFEKSESSQSYFNPPLELKHIDYYEEFTINDIYIKSIKQNHGVIDTLGFIFNNKFGYCTDVVDFPDKSLNYLYNLKVLIITGLRESPHLAHAHFNLSFNWISKLKPKLAYLTHLSPESDHDVVTKLCPPDVYPAYDGLTIDI
jgi:phosphoribosyl 1,2-cyclic phosphate phosphodiesterase